MFVLVCAVVEHNTLIQQRVYARRVGKDSVQDEYTNVQIVFIV